MNKYQFTDADRFSVAPMIDVTNRTFRKFARLMTKKAMLYTEMIAAAALVHNKEYLIEHDESENPCTLQLGGSDPKTLAKACKIGEKFGYSAINLNAGCPSDKVQQGSFGAILMKTPDVITDCLKAMQDARSEIIYDQKLAVQVLIHIHVIRPTVSEPLIFEISHHSYRR